MVIKAVPIQYHQFLTKLIAQFRADKLLNSTLVPRLIDSYGESPSQSKNRSTSNLNPDHATNGEESESTPRTPLKRSPSYVRKMANEDTPLLDEENFEDSGGAGSGGEGEKQDKTVYA